MAKTRRLLLGAAVLAGVLAAAGCTSGSKGSNNTPSGGGDVLKNIKKDSTLAAQVPAAIASKRTLKVGTDPSYPPMEYLDPKDNKTVIGADADLATAIGKKLGLTLQMTQSNFDGIITGMQAGQFDLGISSFYDTKDREQQVNMVSYLKVPSAMMVKKGSGIKIASQDDLCGHKAAAESGTTQADFLTAQVDKCKAAGKSLQADVNYKDQGTANTAVLSGQDDVVLADEVVIKYYVSQSSAKFEQVGNSWEPTVYAVCVPKSAPGLEKAIQGAVNGLIKDGSYGKILKKWDIDSDSVSTSDINSATS
ncbi:MAG: ABC transporter substrate-binding protein [Mycobacteriales bacterium]